MEETRNPKAKGKGPTSSATPSREPSFKNYGSGQQNFQDSQIKSDSCSCVLSRNGSGEVVYHVGAGQKFENSKINGVKVESETTSYSGSNTTSSEIYCTTCGSFINHGTGSQNFEGSVINIG
ncbi:hypothetical protein LR48_Vigan205s006600 [Vigna angularis]|uniref:Uncharacterized protein n=1 Tax=Phaseolus angularis TaxID=3914 RepID=A0A0L9T747_PHAAN|nr:hypothetical protein LR48_Vigan205s006600 [Vigna angularis]